MTGRDVRSILDQTTSICPECLEAISAQIYTDGKAVFMEKTCRKHGTFRGMVWGDLELYKWASRFTKPVTPFASPSKEVVNGCPFDCGLCSEHQQHTCLGIVEITDSCNLGCPICLSSSPHGKNLSLDRVEYMLRKFLEHEGRAVPIQFSGGEPTTRRDLDEVIQIARGIGFKFIEVNTNGISLAKDPKLAKSYADSGLDGIYLQFDGLDGDILSRIRGQDLLDVKKEAISNAKKAGLNVVLAVTVVKGINDDHLWDMIEFALRSGINGINFQPFAFFGRYPEQYANPMERVTTPDIARSIARHSDGVLKPKDFIPVPCPDSRCQMLSYLSVKGESIKPISKFIEPERLLDYYQKFTDPSMMQEAVKEVREIAYEMWSSSAVPGRLKEIECYPACCNTPIPGDSDTKLFPIGVHGMMDTWNLDVVRLRRCCIHEVTPEGTTIPFCLYNTTSRKGDSIYRGKFKEAYYI